jgi:hypothetical protein
MKYCPSCDAPRADDQVQDGHCVVCGTEVVDPSRPQAWDQAGTRRVTTPSPPSPPTPVAPPSRPSDATQVIRLPERLRSPTGAAPPAEEPVRVERPAAQAPPPSPSGSRAGSPAILEYDRLAAEIDRLVHDGFEVFNLVGHAASGKTHFLQALTYLLDQRAVDGTRANSELYRAPVPGSTGAVVNEYVYTGPKARWIFQDAGGELYQLLQENNWEKFGDRSVQLSEWLRRGQGLFCFLHLEPEHFGILPPDVDLLDLDDAERRKLREKRQAKAKDAKEQIQFFKTFLLFLRALRVAEPEVGVRRLLERCAEAGSLEEALHEREGSTPILDVPVMFYFTQADGYRRSPFELRRGLHLDPWRLPLPVHVFTARYLPKLFGAVASQVRTFKFDFLQSYEEYSTSVLGPDGLPRYETYFHAPEDPQVLLSAGIASGLDFVLAHRPAARNEGRLLPPLSTRGALRLHRLLHPKLWRGVPPSLLREE